MLYTYKKKQFVTQDTLKEIPKSSTKKQYKIKQFTKCFAAWLHLSPHLLDNCLPRRCTLESSSVLQRHTFSPRAQAHITLLFALLWLYHLFLFIRSTESCSWWATYSSHTAPGWLIWKRNIYICKYVWEKQKIQEESRRQNALRASSHKMAITIISSQQSTTISSRAVEQLTNDSQQSTVDGSQSRESTMHWGFERYKRHNATATTNKAQCTNFGIFF